MAATGFTPISLYYSATASAVPLAANLVSGELALNTLDGKLYYKNSSNVVTLLAAAAAATGTVSSVAQSFTGGLIFVSGSPITTSGTLALTVAGTSGGIPYFSSASTWASSAALTQYGVVYGGGAGSTPNSTAAGTTGQSLTAVTGGAPIWATTPQGTVTSVATGTGLTGGPITSTGTIAIDSTVVTLTGTQTLSNKTIQGGAINSGTAVASTSGTSIDFTSVPSWAKRITLLFSGVSTSGTSIPQVQIGPTSAVETSNYLGSTVLDTTPINYSSGFLFGSSWAGAVVFYGTVVLQLIDGTANSWVATIVFGRSDQAGTIYGGGGKVISGGALSRIRVTTVNGTDTFDAGKINYFYE
jgi:hypothetical protein